MAQIDILRAKIPEITDTSKDALLYALLDDAQTAILSKRYPFSKFPDEFPEKYNNLQVRLALVYYNKIGVEGQTAHSENGISRTYQNEDSLLKEVVPFVGVVSEETE